MVTINDCFHVLLFGIIKTYIQFNKTELISAMINDKRRNSYKFK